MDFTMDKERKILEIYWSTYAVLFAFCIKKAKITTQHEKQKNETKPSERNKDELIMGLGVSLAKTPVEIMNDLTSGYSMAIFFFLLRVVLCCCLLE